MRKWEEKYKEIQSGKLDARISELQEKFNNKSITRDELKEFEKSKRIKENISKVDNVVEYKNKLEGQLKEIKAEQDRRKSLVDLDKEAKKLDGELGRLKIEKAVAERELKTPNLSDDKKAEIEARLAGIKDKMNKNQESYSKNQLTIAATSKAGGKLAELPDEELAGKRTNISSKISKCNMICGKLIEGYSWDSIDMKLEQWQDRKLTSKKETADKMRNAAKEDKKEKAERTSSQEREGASRESGKGKTTIGRTNPEESKEKPEEEKAGSLVEVSEFDRKHPRLAKIKNFFKRMGQSIKNTFTDKEEDLEEIEKEAEGKVEKVAKGKEEKSPISQEKTPEEKAKEEADDFRAYIKVVADKGMKQADKERLEAKKEALKQKLAEQNEKDEEER